MHAFHGRQFRELANELFATEGCGKADAQKDVASVRLVTRRKLDRPNVDVVRGDACQDVRRGASGVVNGYVKDDGTVALYIDYVLDAVQCPEREENDYRRDEAALAEEW